MQYTLTKPEHIRYVKEQVQGGQFTSPDDVVAAALDRMMKEDGGSAVSPEMRAAIQESRAQLERGEGRDFREAVLELRRKYESE